MILYFETNILGRKVLSSFITVSESMLSFKFFTTEYDILIQWNEILEVTSASLNVLADKWTVFY